MYEDAPGTGNVSLNGPLATIDFYTTQLYPPLQEMTDSTIRSTYINAGKFALVSSIDGTHFAFKTVLSDSTFYRKELMMEFWM